MMYIDIAEYIITAIVVCMMAIIPVLKKLKKF